MLALSYTHHTSMDKYEMPDQTNLTDTPGDNDNYNQYNQQQNQYHQYTHSKVRQSLVQGKQGKQAVLQLSVSHPIVKKNIYLKQKEAMFGGVLINVINIVWRNNFILLNDP